MPAAPDSPLAYLKNMRPFYQPYLGPQPRNLRFRQSILPAPSTVYCSANDKFCKPERARQPLNLGELTPAGIVPIFAAWPKRKRRNPLARHDRSTLRSWIGASTPLRPDPPAQVLRAPPCPTRPTRRPEVAPPLLPPPGCRSALGPANVAQLRSRPAVGRIVPLCHAPTMHGVTPTICQSNCSQSTLW